MLDFDIKNGLIKVGPKVNYIKVRVHLHSYHYLYQIIGMLI
jgi:hypothetical protein